MTAQLFTSDLLKELDSRLAETVCGGVNTASGFCLYNRSDIDINYSLKTPGGSDWTKYSVGKNGGTHWHYYEHSSDLSKWTISFDNNLQAGKDYYIEYALTPTLSNFIDCDYFNPYHFTKVGGGDFLELYTGKGA